MNGAVRRVKRKVSFQSGLVMQGVVFVDTLLGCLTASRLSSEWRSGEPPAVSVQWAVQVDPLALDRTGPLLNSRSCSHLRRHLLDTFTLG